MQWSYVKTFEFVFHFFYCLTSIFFVCFVFLRQISPVYAIKYIRVSHNFKQAITCEITPPLHFCDEVKANSTFHNYKDGY